MASGDVSYPRKRQCPKRTSKIRYGIMNCESTGEEVCIAKHDQVVAIDGSGFLRESVLKVPKDLAAGLIDKYKGGYYGHAVLRIGEAQLAMARFWTTAPSPTRP